MTSEVISTLAVSRARKRERSGRCKASAARRCSAQPRAEGDRSRPIPRFLAGLLGPGFWHREVATDPASQAVGYLSVPRNSLVAYIRRLVVSEPGDADDAHLLDRFIARRDEEAFALLMQRHGPLVWGVCRRVLREEQDVEDAFQATFLVLVRKAHSISKRHSLRSWLYGVASRVAVRARVARGNAGASIVGRLHYLTPAALAEELQAISKPTKSRALKLNAVTRRADNGLDALRAELGLERATGAA